MKLIKNGRLILPDRIAGGLAIVFSDQIDAILPEAEALAKYPEAEIIDAKGNYVSPGLVDVHSHGCGGHDTCDNTPGAIQEMSRMVAGFGVTSWLPTTMTYPLDYLRVTFSQIREAKADSEKDASAWGGAQVLGTHMEGPFIDVTKMGAQNPEYISAPNAAFTKEYEDIIRIVTIAPNVPGGMEFIEEITKDTGIVCSLGHTGANYDCAKAAFAKGADHVTHLFNAQNGLHHRDPGMVGAALTSPEVYTEMICDTFHIHPGVFQLVCDCKKDHLVLITDCMKAGGLPDGKYDLGGQDVFVSGIKCTLASGTIAGSVLRLNKAVQNIVKNTSWPLEEAVFAASLAPARSIRMDAVKGSLEEGKDADILIADPDFEILTTYVRGEKVYER
ncbi:MAG: N-acetylglucosamine-6-phosphate deacetylase [Firmicutes bacterium]|nr:N-acetylglucosamine-6-phosphate deacetylase [Bacillota bacterium]